jgi:hypothetical protein
LGPAAFLVVSIADIVALLLEPMEALVELTIKWCKLKSIRTSLVIIWFWTW